MDRPPANQAPQEKKKWHVATWIALASAATAIVAAVRTNTASESIDRPPENQAPQEKQQQQQKKKKKKKKKKKWHVATWIALASAATAIVAAVLSAHQINVAAAQNIVAEQEQLVTLTTTIAQQLAQGQASRNQSAASQGLATLLGPLQVQGESNASQVAIAELTADGQAATVLINSLHGIGVAGIEYVEVANALVAGGDMDQAITFYNAAVNAPPRDVVTRANALRNEASIYYSLGRNVIAHEDMMAAARLFSGHLLLAHSLIERSIAQAYLADSYYQILIKGCKVASTDIQAAEHVVAQLGPNSSDDATLVALANQDATALAGIASSGGCAAAARGPGYYGAWAWSRGDMPHSIRSGRGDTLAQAETAAVRACEAAGGGSGGSGCYARLWFEDAYSSFAYGVSGGSWGFSWSKSSAEADSRALSECSTANGATDCAIIGRARTPNPTSPRGAEVQPTRG